MKSIKIIDLKPHTKRKGELYDFLGGAGIFPAKVHVGKGVFFVLIPDDTVEEMVKEETKEKAKEAGFQITMPLEYQTMRTVVVKDLDSLIEQYSSDEIAHSIERVQEWARVEEVVKFETTSRIIKVRFLTSNMAQRAEKEGLIVLNQSIPPRRMERELFIRLTPCNNCYGYNHESRQCPEEKMILCVNCGAEGHRQGDCTAREPRCINCDGDHRTLAARCPVRKGLIKQKRKEIRERSKSRNRGSSQSRGNIQYGGASYAGVTRRETANGDNEDVAMEIPNEMKDITTTIMSSIIYGYFWEMINPGTFQDNVDKMYEENGLCKVRFPKRINIEKVKSFYKDIMKTTPTDPPPTTQEEKESEPQRNQEEERIVQSMDYEKEGSSKRNRSFQKSPEQENEQQHKRTKNEGLQASATGERSSRESRDGYTSPPPPPNSPQKTLEEQQATAGPPSTITGTKEKRLQHRERSTSTERGETRPRSGSLSSVEMRAKAKELGLIVHVPERQPYIKMFQEGLNSYKKEEMINAIYKGDAKITWIRDIKLVDKTKIIKSLQKRVLLPQDLVFRMEKKDVYNRIQERPRTTMIQSKPEDIEMHHRQGKYPKK